MMPRPVSLLLGALTLALVISSVRTAATIEDDEPGPPGLAPDDAQILTDALVDGEEGSPSQAKSGLDADLKAAIACIMRWQLSRLQMIQEKREALREFHLSRYTGARQRSEVAEDVAVPREVADPREVAVPSAEAADPCADVGKKDRGHRNKKEREQCMKQALAAQGAGWARQSEEDKTYRNWRQIFPSRSGQQSDLVAQASRHGNRNQASWPGSIMDVIYGGVNRPRPDKDGAQGDQPDDRWGGRGGHRGRKPKLDSKAIIQLVLARRKQTTATAPAGPGTTVTTTSQGSGSAMGPLPAADPVQAAQAVPGAQDVDADEDEEE